MITGWFELRPLMPLIHLRKMPLLPPFVCVLIIIAFFTLLERNLLGSMQSRTGPLKVGVWGLIQPLGDAVKLLRKHWHAPTKGSRGVYYFAPVLLFSLAILCWILIPQSRFPFIFSGFMYIVIARCAVYPLFLAGWSSNSKYSILGSLRGVAQTISYEVSFIFILLSIFVLYTNMTLNYILYNKIFIVLLWLPLRASWFVTIYAESNRAPFDLAEGERELVSGFNTEYRGSTFTLLFIGEYIIMVRLSALTSIILLNSNTVITMLVITSFIYARGIFPRMRIDRLINMTWKIILPLSLLTLLFLIVVRSVLSTGFSFFLTTIHAYTHVRLMRDRESLSYILWGDITDEEVLLRRDLLDMVDVYYL